MSFQFFDSFLHLDPEAPGFLLTNTIHLFSNLDVSNFSRSELNGRFQQKALERIGCGEDGIGEECAEISSEGESVALAGERGHVLIRRSVGGRDVEWGGESVAVAVVGRSAGRGCGRLPDFGRSSILGRW